MSEPIFTYCREVLPASTVDRSVSLSFTGAGKTELALARGNMLELYEVEFVKRQQGRYGGSDENSRDEPSEAYMHRNAKGDEFDFPMITGGSRREGNGGRLRDSKVPQLHLLGQWSLNGAIKDLKAVRCGMRGRRGIDSLLLSFTEAKMSLVSFEASTQTIVTESIHFYEHEALKPKSFNDHQSCDLRVDPAGRCAIMRIYEDQLAVLPLIGPDEPSSNGAKPYMDSYVVNLRSADIEIHNVRDFVFLNGYLEPTLAVLHERQVTWAGMAEKQRDTCVVSMLSLDVARRVMSVIQTASGLPYDCHTIVPVPQPIGGVVVVAASSISHISNGTLTCISVLSKLACFGIGMQMRDFIDRTNIGLEMVLDPSRCGTAFIRFDTMAMWTHMGQVFLIRLAGDGRRVERIVVKQIAGVDFRKDEQKPQAHSWESFNVLPSSVTEFKITNDEGDDGQGRDSQYMFIGGNDGRSVLVEVEETQATAKRSGSGGATAKGDIDDIDAMLYGDTGMGAQHTLSTSKDKDASGSDGSVNPEVADGQDDSEGWQTHFRFTVHDEILGTGSIVGMDVGASALATSRSSGDEGLELVTCAGNEWRGSVRVQQRHIRPDIVASFDLPGAPVRRVWTVRCRKEYNIGGVMQAADDESLDELTDTFMILSRDASTAVFRAGDELSEVERSGFSTAVGTIDVSEILDHTRVVQVVADGIRVVNAQGKETQTIKLDVGVTVVSAQISDPYVLVKTSDGRLQLFEASTGTRKLAPVALPSTLSGVDEVAATSFFEDTHGVLTSTREWIERNPELYAEQLDESCRDGNTDEDAELDYLYTDHTQIGKRRPGAGSGSGGRQGGAKKRRHVAKGGFDDLYEDEESDDNDTSEIGDEAAAQEHGWEDSYKEREGAESRTYLAVVWKGGDLSLLRLPQFDEVWRTPRFDYMAEVLAAETRGDLGAESGDDDNGDDDSGAAASAAAVPQAAAARQLDQFGVVQVGGRDLCNTLLVAVSTAGEVAVYRAFEHCARERLVQAKQATDGAAVFDQLAIRFVRVPHSVLAYEPGYEADVRKAQRRQARAFDAWQKREKVRLERLALAERQARERAKEKKRREESDMVADWGESDDDNEDGGDGSSSKGNEGDGDGDGDPADGHLVAEAEMELDADEPDLSDEFDIDYDPSTPLQPASKLTVLDNIGGYAGVFITGARPMVVMVGHKQYARVHPLRLPVRLPHTLLPQSATAPGFDAVAAGLLARHQPVIGVARFHSPHCRHGFVALTQAGTLVVCMLPASAQVARGGIEYDAPWPVRTLPVGTAHAGVSTLGGVAFHAPSGSYAVAAASVAPFRIKEPDPELAARLVEQQIQAADGDAERQAQLAGITPDQLDPQQALIPEHSRPDIPTTTAAPLVTHCSVALLSPVTWETVDAHVFADNEHATAMRTLELESRQTAGGRRAFLCVATAFVLGEDVSARGKVYIFDVIEVVPLPGRPQTNRRLKLVCQDEVRGAITALGELRGHLAVAVGSKMYVRSFEDNEKLLSVAFLDCQTWVRSLVGLKGFLLIADMVNSLWFAGFQEEGPTKVQVLGRDFTNKLPVETAEFLVRGSQMQLLAADAYGHMHFFLYAPKDVHSLKGQKLLRRGEFNLHSRVTAIKRLVARSDDSQQICLVGSANGSIMAVSMLDERTFKRMHRMNTQLVHGVVPLAGLNPREYRAVPLHLRQYHSPRRTVLDANLLVPMFAHGSVLRQRETAQRVGTTADRVLRDIVHVEQCFGLL